MINIRVIVSDDDCHAVGDNNIEKWYDGVLGSASQGDNIHVATEVMLNRLRLGHKAEDVFIEAVICNDDIIFVDGLSYPRLPRGVFDQHEDIIARLLGWRN